VGLVALAIWADAHVLIAVDQCGIQEWLFARDLWHVLLPWLSGLRSIIKYNDAERKLPHAPKL
jgi:hypothetical protein